MAARTALVPTTLPRLPDMTPTANAADVAMVASDIANGNVVPYTGKEVLIAHNDDVGAVTITIAGNADAIGRTGSITAYSIGAGEIAVFDLSHPVFNTLGYINIDASDADLMVGVAIVASMP